ncbi:hypothetical protein C2E23DRAFT_727539, partial [Lenzites betulinus]
LSDRRKLLLHYVAIPDKLWNLLSCTRAVVGGFAALSFFLRDPSARPDDLQIFVPTMFADELEALLVKDEALQIKLISVRDHRTNPHTMPPRVRRITTYSTLSRRSISIHASASDSPLEPIARSTTSALINWVSPHAFVCAYPTLTIRRLSLGRTIGDSSPQLHVDFAHLIKLNFNISSDPFGWSEYANIVPPPSQPWHHACLRAYHLCPDQSRYFGDGGSFQTVFDLLRFNEQVMRRERQLPFGITVAWRLDCSTRTCTELCLFYDPLLPNYTFTTPITLVPSGTTLQTTYDFPMPLFNVPE